MQIIIAYSWPSKYISAYSAISYILLATGTSFPFLLTPNSRSVRRRQCLCAITRFESQRKYGVLARQWMLIQRRRLLYWIVVQMLDIQVIHTRPSPTENTR
jgi:hypothetical protein